MLACLDVFYAGSNATAACVLFDEWRAATAADTLVGRFSGVAAYEPGNFFRRELPPLLGILSAVPQRPDVVIIDGYVWLGAADRPGLGAHLFDALNRMTPVVGVAKTVFPGAPAVEVLRGQSKTPLYVTAVGLDAGLAAENVCGMHGDHRIPTLLRLADQLSRG